MKCFSLTNEDIQKARRLYERERIYPINRKGIFLGAVYCIILQSDNYEKSQKIYKSLISNNLTTLESFKQNKRKVKKLLKPARFPNRKLEYIYKFIKWFERSRTVNKIIEDIKNGRRDGPKLREEIAENAPGLGYKSASFLMNKVGYLNLVTIDIHMLRWLKNLGYEVKIPDYKHIGGIQRNEYLKYEGIVKELARKCSIEPTIYQFAVWLKSTSQNFFE